MEYVILLAEVVIMLVGIMLLTSRTGKFFIVYAHLVIAFDMNMEEHPLVTHNAAQFAQMVYERYLHSYSEQS